MNELERCASYEDYRGLARRRLPRVLFDYIDGGSYSETTLHRNVADIAAATIEQRVGVDMSRLDLSIDLLGRRWSMPVALGPVGFGGMYARRGEVQAARAAAAAGVPFCLSTVGICSIGELEAAGLPFWFQLYIVRDRGLVDALVDRAAAAGCTTLVVTLDLPTPGVRYHDIRSGMAGRLDWAGQLKRIVDGVTHPRWLYDVHLRGRPHSFGNLAGVAPAAGSFAAAWEWIGANFDCSVTWDDIARLRSRWRGILLVKGIMHTDDARKAIGAGCDGVIVSNHGGRQLDGASSSIAVLPAIAETLAGHATVLVDSGFRSGLDVLKALKRGADGCLIGRSWAMALAAGGQRGVERTIAAFGNELRSGLILSGGLDRS